MPKVRVENVEDEECYNFILLKCPTKRILNLMLFNNLAFCPVWLFLDMI